MKNREKEYQERSERTCPKSGNKNSPCIRMRDCRMGNFSNKHWAGDVGVWKGERVGETEIESGRPKAIAHRNARGVERVDMEGALGC